MQIAIVEGHLMLRDALRYACTRHFGHVVVAESGSGAEGLELIARLKPDVLLLDVRLSGQDGFGVAERALEAVPSLRVLIVSSLINEFTVYRVDRLPVHGFIDINTCAIEEIHAALEAVREGGVYFSSSFLAARRMYHADPRSFAKVLSPTEQEVLSLIGRGLSNDEIGARLRITPRTAQTHRSNILLKLRIRGTPKLIHFAVERGFVNDLELVG